MDRIKDELIWLRSPDLADVFLTRHPSEGLRPVRVVAGCHEVYKVRFQLVVVFVVNAFNGRLFDGVGHSFNLSIDPWMVGLVTQRPITFVSQILSNRICREYTVVRLRGCSVNWLPLSVTIVLVRKGRVLSRCSRNSRADLSSAVSTSWATTNLLVLSISTKILEVALRCLDLGDVAVKEADRASL